MYKYILVLVTTLSIVPIVASAQSPEAKQAVAFCEAKYAGATSTARLQQVLCIQEQNLRILEARLQKGEGALKAEVDRLRKELEAAKAAPQTRPGSEPSIAPTPGKVAEARAAIEKRVAELKAGKAKPAQPSPPPVATPPPAPHLSGAPYRIVPTPGQFAAATFPIDGPNLNVQHLSWALEKFVRGADQVRIVVRKNGALIPIAQADGNLGVVYADLNRDGMPDRSAYSSVDPSAINEFWVPNVGPRDKIEVIYLVPTGKMIAIPGLPPQILWGDPVRVQLDPVPRTGRWLMDAHNAWPI